MKKALALVLALVLALSLGVPAFALRLVELEEDEKSTATVIDISDPKYNLSTRPEYEDVYLVTAKGGTFYVRLDGTEEYKNIEVTGTGIVSAKLVDYNPDKMTGAPTNYRVEKNGVVYNVQKNDADVYDEIFEDYKYLDGYEFVVEITNKAGKTIATENVELTDKQVKQLEKQLKKVELDEVNINAIKDLPVVDITGIKGAKGQVINSIVEVYACDFNSYEVVKALAKALNDKYMTNTFAAANYDEDNIYVIELTVEPNYSAAYKKGSVKVTANRVDGKDKYGRDEVTPVSASFDIISDVAIFEYNMVNWAGENDKVLVVADYTGYSDYLTAENGYGVSYDDLGIRDYKATVISTTAFRALRENKWGIKVDSENLLVTIPEVVAGQKGVNFAAKKVTYNAVTDAVEFGFYGDQVIASDFTIEANLGVDAYELRELFGKKVEEEDVITYYVLKDGKAYDSFTYDYMSDDIDENVLLKIEGKAGDTLGMYSIVLNVPAEPEAPAEENPNTGAESVIGVVAAMAVVSVAAAAAVSLKK